MHQFPYHLFVFVFEWACVLWKIAVVRHGNENINCSCHECRLRNYYLFIFSTWPKRQDYRFTQPQTCNFTESREEEKTEPSDTQTLLECLFLLRFDKCWEENVVCQSDETEKLANGWLRWINIYLYTYMYAKVETRKAHLLKQRSSVRS